MEIVIPIELITWIGIALGAISCVLGFLFLINKRLLANLEDSMNRAMVSSKAITDKYNKPIGIILLMLSFVLLKITLFKN